MAKMTIELKNELENLIHEYGVHKKRMDDLKKKCDKENARIKEIMSSNDLDEFESGDFTANYSVQERESINELGFIEFAKKHKEFEGVVKLKEYVDTDELEKKIYTNTIPKKLLLEIDKFKDVKEVPTLRVTKKKEKNK